MIEDIESQQQSAVLSYDEIQQVIRRGRAERNQAVGSLFVGFGGLFKGQLQAFKRLSVRFGDWLDPQPTPHR